MNTVRIRVTLLGVAMLLSGLPCPGDPTAPGRWTKERANAWYATQPWLVGCNFVPSTACNQLEMWQAATIDRELGFAERLGFTSVRVFLHDLLWLHDKNGLVRRVDQFLGIAQKHKIGVMLVLFDSCWNPLPKAGPQPEPRPRTHNAGWAQSPSVEMSPKPAYERLRELIKARWWSKLDGATDAQGQLRARLYYGDYQAAITLPNGAELKKSLSWSRHSERTPAVTI
jgi:hypothetical protein